MKLTLLFTLLLFLQGGGPPQNPPQEQTPIVIEGNGNRLTRIANTNQLKEQAEEAFAEKRFADAVTYYDALVTQWGDSSDAVRLNRAHALLGAQKKEEASAAYRQLAETSSGRAAKSSAFQQLGYLASEAQELPAALQYYKDALKANPANETARHNYELAWRALKNQENKKNEQQKPDDQPKEDQPKIEPSAWAEQQKAKADQLYRQYRYKDALQLMQQGLQKDSTVAAYNDYIRRLGDIVEIDQ